jgi:hypothetical protein
MKISSLLCGISFACAFALSAQAAGPSYPSFADKSRTSGFGTNAAVALAWKFGEGTIRSVGVKKAALKEKGIICVEPSAALNTKGVYPQVTVSYDMSNTLNGTLAFVDLQNRVCPVSNIEVDTFQLSNGKEVASSSVGFFLIVE